MARKEIGKVAISGNFDFLVQKRKDDALTGDVNHYPGLVSIALTVTQESTKIPADNITYFTLMATARAEGTITIASMKASDYEHLYTVFKDKNSILWFGGNTVADEVGMSFKQDVTKSDGTTSIDMLSFPKVSLTLPDINTVTRSEDATEITNAEIKVSASVVSFTDTTTSETKYALWGVANSVDNQTIWASLKDTIFVPEMAVTEI